MEVKNKKGFTLIEILAVIVLISLIIIIAVPSVKSISIKSKKKLFDTKVKLTEEAVNLWGINNKTCFEVEGGCNVLSYCYLESNIYTCETTFGILAEQGIINYDEEYNGDGYVVNPLDSGSMNDFKLIVTLDNNNKMINADFDDDDDSVKYVPIDRDAISEPTSSSGSVSNQTAKYSVVYWLQNIGAGTAENSINYLKTKIEEKEGISGQNVTPLVSLYTGFNSPKAQTVTIKSDGSTVVNYYYTRKSYTITLNKGSGISSVSGAGSYQYGESVTINAAVSSGYTWNKWSGDYSTTTQKYTFTMPSYDITYTANATEITTTTQLIKCNSFSSDSWENIQYNIKNNNYSCYNVGDKKQIYLTGYGYHYIRIVNKSRPSSCNNTGFGQTACGFVFDFETIVLLDSANDIDTNVGGWPASKMRTVINSSIYNALPRDLKNVITKTNVVSGHERGVSSNYTSYDYLFLPSISEIYSGVTVDTDSAVNSTRQLDYFRSESNNGISGALELTLNGDLNPSLYPNTPVKTYNSDTYIYRLRNACPYNNFGFNWIDIEGYVDDFPASQEMGFSPLFKIN